MSIRPRWQRFSLPSPSQLLCQSLGWRLCVRIYQWAHARLGNVELLLRRGDISDSGGKKLRATQMTLTDAAIVGGVQRGCYAMP